MKKSEGQFVKSKQIQIIMEKVSINKQQFYELTNCKDRNTNLFKFYLQFKVINDEWDLFVFK